MSIFNKTSEILRDVFVSGGTGGSIAVVPTTESEAFRLVHDENNHALRVNIVGGSGGSGGTGLWEECVVDEAPATYATYSGIPNGCSTTIELKADNAGEIGNDINLSGNGVDDIATLLNNWNTNNPSNTASLVSGDDTQIIANKSKIFLSGGNDIIPSYSTTGVRLKNQTTNCVGDYGLVVGTNVKMGFSSKSSYDYNYGFGYNNESFVEDTHNNYGNHTFIIGKDNIIKDAQQSYILGRNNLIDGSSDNTILYGYGNEIISPYVPGKANNISNAIGGIYNTISRDVSNYGTILYSTIFGAHNTIETTGTKGSYGSFITGKNNKIASYENHSTNYTSIIGGNNNTIEIPVGGGLDTTSSSIIGGEYNYINECNNSAIIGGNNQTLSRNNVVMVPELEISNDGKGIRLTTPDGLNQYDITIDNAGNIVSTLV